MKTPAELVDEMLTIELPWSFLLPPMETPETSILFASLFASLRPELPHPDSPFVKKVAAPIPLSSEERFAK
jgi:hypothetical protein